MPSALPFDNFSQFESLQLSIKVSSDVQGEIKVILRDSEGAYGAWLTQGFLNDNWLTLTLPLLKPTLQSNPELNLGHIIQVQVGFQT